MTVLPFRPRWRPLDLALCIAAGATALELAYLSTWLLVVAHWPWAPRGFVDIFAPHPIESVEALLIGGDYALACGGLIGAAAGAAFNLACRLLRRDPTRP
jgi:hypothetical protein